MTSIVVVEDENIMGSLLRDWIESAVPNTSVTYFSTYDAADQHLSQGETQILVTDLMLGDTRTGLELGIAAKRANPQIGVVVLSSHVFPSLLTRVPRELVNGWAYLLKQHRSPEDLPRAIEVVQHGMTMVDPHLSAIAGNEDDNPINDLSPIEADVLALVAAGWSNKAIADQRRLSIKSVEHALTGIYSKLGAESTDVSDDSPKRAGSGNPRVMAVLAYLDYCTFTAS